MYITVIYSLFSAVLNMLQAPTWHIYLIIYLNRLLYAVTCDSITLSVFHSNESKEDMQSVFRGSLVDFLESSDKEVFCFSPSLSSHERRIVHEVHTKHNTLCCILYPQLCSGVYAVFSHVFIQLCEELGLLHESKGQGRERYIQVKKRRRGASAEPCIKESSIESQEPGTIIASGQGTCAIYENYAKYK